MDALLEKLNKHHDWPRCWFWMDVAEKTGCEYGRTDVKTIKIVVARYFGVRVHDLNSHVRTRPEVRARHVGMYLTQYLTELSHEKIGRHFNRQGHWISLFACRKIQRMVDAGHPVAKDIENIKAELNWGQ